MSAVATVAAVIIVAASSLELAERDLGMLAEVLDDSLAEALIVGAVVAARIGAAVLMLVAVAQWVAGGAA